MIQNFTDVLPFTQYSPADEVAMYSLNGISGMGGRFVVLETGNNNPELSAGDYSAATPGYNYAGLTNLRYENKRKFKYATSGATRYNTLGLVLYGTTEFDKNDLKLIMNPHRKVELGVVYSGETNNVLTDGIVRLRSTAYSGIPIPGYVAVINPVSNDGGVMIVDPASLAATGVTSPFVPLFQHVVAKVISSSGTAGSFGGYADFKLMLK
jgi:hypothetical protein